MGFDLKFHGQFRRRISSSPDDQIVIMLPDLRLLLIIARSLLLFITIIAFLCVRFAIRSADDQQLIVADDDDFFLEDLKNEGLLKSGHRALVIFRSQPQISKDAVQIDRVSEFDDERQRSIPDETYDFVFADGFRAAEFIDRTIKIAGVVAVRLGADAFRVPQNYKIVYIQRLESTVVAMKKIGISRANRQIFTVGSDDGKYVRLDSRSTGLSAAWFHWIKGGEASSALLGTEAKIWR